MDESARHLIVQRDRSRPPEDRRLREGLGRSEAADSQVDGEGNSEAVAERFVDEPQAGPAGGAEGTRIGCGGAASGTGGRVDEAESGFAGLTPQSGGAPEDAAAVIG